MILSLLKYANEHANENTKRGTKTAPTGYPLLRGGFCNEVQRKNACQRMSEGTGRKIRSEEISKTMRIFNKAVPQKIQRIPIKRRRLFCTWQQGEELGAEIIRGCQGSDHRGLFRHIPIIQLHTFLRRDRRQIQRIKTNRIPDLCGGRIQISNVSEKEKKEKAHPSRLRRMSFR